MDDPLDERLNTLVDLRNRGILSDAEYRKARKRLLHANGSGDGPGSAKRSILRSYWPAFAGLAILILLVVALTVYGRISARSEGVDLDIPGANESTAILDADAAGNAERCGASEARDQINQMVFDRAVRLYGGDPAPLNSLRRAVGVRLEAPAFRNAETQADRIHCSARLLLDVPPSVREAFDGATTLEADIEYAVSASSGGNTTVTEVDGVDTLVQRLADGASLAGQRRAAKSFNPSFDCATAQSDVEKMICADEDLSRLDRAISSRYVEYRQSLDPGAVRELGDSQRAFLERRGQCLDVACIRDLYVAQGRYLDRIGQAQEGMPE